MKSAVQRSRTLLRRSLPGLFFLAMILAALFTVKRLAVNPVLMILNIDPRVLNIGFSVPLFVVLFVLLLNLKGCDDSRRPRLFLLLALLAFAFLLFHSLYYSLIYDDAYISYRYVHNVLNGDGLVFNPGERVEAYSNFLWVIVIAFLRLLLRPLGIGTPLIALLLSFLAASGIAYSLKHYFQHLHFRFALYYYLPFLAVNTFFAFWLYGGIETAAFASLLVAAYVLWLTGRENKLAWIFSIIILLRADGFVYVLAFLLAILTDFLLLPAGRLGFKGLIDFWRRRGMILAVPAATFLGQVGFRLLYYGFPLPNTFYAKVGASLPAKIGNGLEYVGEFFKLNGWVFVLLLFLFIALEKKITGRFLLSPFLILSVLYFIYLGGDSLIHFRFIAHLIPLLLLLPVLLIEYLARELKTRGLKLSYLVLVVLFFFQGNHSLYISYKYQFRGWYPLTKKKQQYEEMYRLGEFFNKNYGGRSIALGAVGIIPYLAGDMRIIDILGLADRRVAHLDRNKTDFHIGHNKWDIDYVLNRKPLIIIPPKYIFRHRPSDKEISRQNFLYGRDLMSADEFRNCYRPQVKEINGDFYLFFLRRNSSNE